MGLELGMNGRHNTQAEETDTDDRAKHEGFLMVSGAFQIKLAHELDSLRSPK